MASPSFTKGQIRLAARGPVAEPLSDDRVVLGQLAGRAEDAPQRVRLAGTKMIFSASGQTHSRIRVPDSWLGTSEAMQPNRSPVRFYV